MWNPARHGPFEAEDIGDIADPNGGYHALDPKQYCNEAFLDQEEWLLLMFTEVNAVASLDAPSLRTKCTQTMALLRQEWTRMQIHKEREWERQKQMTRQAEHMDLREWLARLLARPGMEDVMDDMLRRASGDCPSVMHDTWDAPIFRLLELDGKRFVDAPLGEGRYIFGLSVDGFNPFQSKQAKQQVTVTAIYMYCFNLPPELRYLPENVYLVGVIP
ncbi:hypothetical protein BV20DRAFT_958767, partial [Pilatotrama ljubarskyi]